MRRNELTDEQVLRHAARISLDAPSIFNTQPWRWEADPEILRLYADRQRRLLATDPQGRLLVISCGGALHHARTALAVAGDAAKVQRLPDRQDPDLLAELRLSGTHEPTLAELHMHAAIRRRRTDRRPFTDQPVAQAICQEMIAVAQAEGAHLHIVGGGQIAALASAAARAGALQLSDEAYQAELADWTDRPLSSGGGVPISATVGPVPRRVPVRDFAPFGGETMPAGPGRDRGARYMIVSTDGDEPMDWLRAGEAMSAVLLTAVSEELGTAPISHVTEFPDTREELRSMVPGGRWPQLMIRVGHAPPGEPAQTARRYYDEAVNPITP